MIKYGLGAKKKMKNIDRPNETFSAKSSTSMLKYEDDLKTKMDNTNLHLMNIHIQMFFKYTNKVWQHEEE